MKKVLIITYYWIPSGGPGIQRLIKFLPHFPRLGWQPIVLTVEKGDYPAIDESLAQKIPPECKVYKTPVWEPYHLYRKLTGKSRDEKIPTYVLNPSEEDSFKEKLAKWVRAKLFIPDARIGWLPHAVHRGIKIIGEENIDLIFSSSPPHTVQLIARRLTNKTGIKWVADFRDPWSEAFWVAELQKEGLVKKLNLAMEKSVLRRADAVVTVTPAIRDMLAAKAPNRYEVIYNGFEQLFTEPAPSDTFRILFFGYLNKYQNWEPLLRAVNRLPEMLRKEIEINFVGRVFEGFRENFRKYEHLRIVFRKYMPHDELMRFAREASILFRPMSSMAYSSGAIGAKLFDYLALRKPILAIGQKESVVAKVLEETGSGQVFETDEIGAIAEFITEIYRKWQNQKYVLLDDNPQLVQYHTATNVKRLVSLFEEVLEGK